MAATCRRFVYPSRLPQLLLILCDAGSETYFLKLRFLSDSYALLVTDMLNVWYCHSDPESVIDEKQVRCCIAKCCRC